MEAISCRKWLLSHLSLQHQKHVPASCPLLAELNLKLIWVSLPAAGPPAVAPAPAVSLSSGRRSVVAEAYVLGLMESANAPSRLDATVAEEYELDNNFRGDGDESGVEFRVPLCCLSLTTTVPFTFTTLCAIIRSSRLCLLNWPLLDRCALFLWLHPSPVLSSPKPLHPSPNKCWLPLSFLSWAVILLSLILALPSTSFLTSRPLSHTSW